MIRILEVLRRAVQVFVDADQTWVVGVAAQGRMILEFTESLGKFDVLGSGEVLVAKEQNLVFEQQSLDLGKECIISRDLAEIHPGQLCPIEQVNFSTRIVLVDEGRFSVSVAVLVMTIPLGSAVSVQTEKTEEPILRPDSMSWCARTASSRGYRWLISILIRPDSTWENSSPASSARSSGSAM